MKDTIMRPASYILFLICWTTITIAATYYVVNPTQHLASTQRSIINQFVARYCHPNWSLPREFLMGEAAALSRVTVGAGLEPVAWAEYIKCKALEAKK